VYLLMTTFPVFIDTESYYIGSENIFKSNNNNNKQRLPLRNVLKSVICFSKFVLRVGSFP
jgi:predicted RNA-binding protein